MVSENVYYFQSMTQRDSKAAWFIEAYPQVAREAVFITLKYGINNGVAYLQHFVDSQDDGYTLIYILRHNTTKYGLVVYSDLIQRFQRGNIRPKEPEFEPPKAAPEQPVKVPYGYGYNKDGKRERAAKETRISTTGKTYEVRRSLKTGRFLSGKKRD